MHERQIVSSKFISKPVGLRINFGLRLNLKFCYLGLDEKSVDGVEWDSTERWSKPLGVACGTFLSSWPGVFASCGACIRYLHLFCDTLTKRCLIFRQGPLKINHKRHKAVHLDKELQDFLSRCH